MQYITSISYRINEIKSHQVNLRRMLNELEQIGNISLSQKTIIHDCKLLLDFPSKNTITVTSNSINEEYFKKLLNDSFKLCSNFIIPEINWEFRNKIF